MLVAILDRLVVRIAVVLVSSGVLRYIHRPIPTRWQTVLVSGGLRGSMALALALSLPVSLGAGSPSPDRDLILVMTFGVISLLPLIQGLTMEPLLGRLGLISRDGKRDEYETISARKAMSSAALAEVEKLGKAVD